MGAVEKLCFTIAFASATNLYIAVSLKLRLNILDLREQPSSKQSVRRQTLVTGLEALVSTYYQTSSHQMWGLNLVLRECLASSATDILWITLVSKASSGNPGRI